MILFVHLMAVRSLLVLYCLLCSVLVYLCVCLYVICLLQHKVMDMLGATILGNMEQDLVATIITVILELVLCTSSVNVLVIACESMFLYVYIYMGNKFSCKVMAIFTFKYLVFL